MNDVLRLVLDIVNHVEQDTLATLIVADKTQSTSEFEFLPVDEGFVKKIAPTCVRILAKRGFSSTFETETRKKSIEVKSKETEEVKVEEQDRLFLKFTTELQQTGGITMPIEVLVADKIDRLARPLQ